MTYSEDERDAHQEGDDQVDVLHSGRLSIENGDGLFALWYTYMKVLCKGCIRWKVYGLRRDLAVLSIRALGPMTTRQVNDGLHPLMLISAEHLSSELLQEVKSTS